MSTTGHYSGQNAGLVTDKPEPMTPDDAHDDGCPARYGDGDCDESAETTPATRAPRTSWCWWCRRAVRFEDADAHRVQVRYKVEGTFGEWGIRTEWVCGRCWEKSDPEVPLDMTEEDREGQPEFNGAFGNE